MDAIVEEGIISADSETIAIAEEKKPKVDEKQGNCYW